MLKEKSYYCLETSAPDLEWPWAKITDRWESILRKYPLLLQASIRDRTLARILICMCWTPYMLFRFVSAFIFFFLVYFLVLDVLLFVWQLLHSRKTRGTTEWCELLSRWSISPLVECTNKSTVKFSFQIKFMSNFFIHFSTKICEHLALILFQCCRSLLRAYKQ